MQHYETEVMLPILSQSQSAQKKNNRRKVDSWLFFFFLRYLEVKFKPTQKCGRQANKSGWDEISKKSVFWINLQKTAPVPVQILAKPLRPILLEHFIHVIFLQLTFVTYSKKGIEPPDGEISRGHGQKSDYFYNLLSFVTYQALYLAVPKHSDMPFQNPCQVCTSGPLGLVWCFFKVRMLKQWWT